MHAAVVSVNITDPSADPDRKGLREVVIPNTKSQPGFVTGYWMALAGDKGQAVVVFETEQAASSALSSMAIKVGANPAPGVTVTSVELAEVVGHA